jgi:6,7-dimethyl-8-ribityllumazine synthase
MVRAAQAVLKKAHVKKVEVVRVPGAYEIPVVAATLARQRPPLFSAIICLGVVFRGETTHARHIAEAVSQSLAHSQVMFGVPIIHGVFLFESEEQAQVRCSGSKYNRGTEAANTALEMAEVMNRIRPQSAVEGES